ncbi:MAG: S1/P1 nuclease [Acidobacteriota bacterium]
MNRVLKTAGLLLLAWAAAAPAGAWFAGGHIVVAKIAHDRLSTPAKVEADRLIGVLADFSPARADFVSASVWLDEIKEVGWNTFDTWHYISLPYNPEGLRGVPPALDNNAVAALEESLETLKNPDAGDLARAFSLRVVIHLVGDLHQPLHCISRFSKRLPQGDRGGNDFPLADKNLHLYWDAAAGLLGDLDSSSSSEDVAAAVEGLLQAVPEEAMPPWQGEEPLAWAQESYGLAVSVAYVGLIEGREPPESYRIRAQLVSQRRLVTAGYRLAAVLEDALAPRFPATR